MLRLHYFDYSRKDIAKDWLISFFNDCETVDYMILKGIIYLWII